MIFYRELAHFGERREEFQKWILTDLHSTTWLVSDLKSKQILESTALKYRCGWPGKAIMRTSELWRELYSEVDAKCRWVSPNFVRIQLESEFGASAAKTLFNYLEALSFLIFHPLENEISEEFFRSSRTWQGTYIRARDWAQRFVQSGLISTRWAKPLLQSELHWEDSWSRQIQVDLGLDMRKTDAEFLIRLGSRVPVRILAPAQKFLEGDVSLREGYDLLRSYAQEVQLAHRAPNERVSGERVLRRFASPVAETKCATEWVTAKSAEASATDFLCASAEFYPLILRHHLGWAMAHNGPHWCEGQMATRATSVPNFNPSWKLFLSMVRQIVDPNHLSYSDRLRLFLEDEVLPFSLNHFMSENRSRPNLESFVDTEKTHSGLASMSSIGIDDFESLWIHLLQGQESAFSAHEAEWIRSRVDHALSALQRESLPAPVWLRCLGLADNEENFWSNEETRIQLLYQNECLESKRRLFLGLSQEALSPTLPTRLSPEEINSLNQDFGIFVENPDVQRLRHEIDWLCSDPESENWLSFAETNATGEPQTPSSWFMGVEVLEESKFAKMPLDLSENDGTGPVTPKGADHFSKVAVVDLQILEGMSSSAVGKENLRPTLSISALMELLRCPFRYKARYIYRLSDDQDESLDLNAKTWGILLHRVLEMALGESGPVAFSENQIQSWIVAAGEFQSLSRSQMSFLQKRSVHGTRLVKRFLDEEMVRFRQFPGLRVWKKEYRFKSSWEGLDFVGVIDRVDRVENSEGPRLFVTDYKSSTGALSGQNTWIQNNHLQILFYLWVLSREPTSNERIVLAGGRYYDLRGRGEHEAIRVEPFDREFLLPDRKRDKVANLEGLFMGLEERLRYGRNLLKVGDFAPRPLNPVDCSICRWRTMCKAPHL